MSTGSHQACIGRRAFMLLPRTYRYLPQGLKPKSVSSVLCLKQLIMRFISTFIFLFSFTLLRAQGPEITSWIINTDGDTGYGNFPTNVLEVAYTADNVYINASCIPSYEIGPWTANPNTPSNQDFSFIITRNPIENTGVDVQTGLGQIGVWKNGVVFFNAKDAFSYNNQNTWFQNAIVVEGLSFDECLGHPAPGGTYHTHLNPGCLYDFTDGTQHAPLLGFAFDGFPIYGAYSFENTDGTGDIVLMETSYQLRDITERTTLPDGTVLNANQYGPAVDNTDPLGYYIEDYEYVSGSGHLDEHNGRWCITPEYPNGTYCYFATITSEYEGAYPYTVGPSYYGTVQAGNTGPNGGNVTVPGNATVYSPSGVSVAEQSAWIMRTLANAWVFEGVAIQSWEVRNATGQLVSKGEGSFIPNHEMVEGVYFAILKAVNFEMSVRLMK